MSYISINKVLLLISCFILKYADWCKVNVNFEGLDCGKMDCLPSSKKLWTLSDFSSPLFAREAFLPHIMESRKNFAYWFQNPAINIEIRNPCSTDKEFRVHSVESRIQNCLGLPSTWEAGETRERKTESAQGTVGEAKRREANITLKFDTQTQNQSECLFTLIGYLNTIQFFYTNNNRLSNKLSYGITKQIISACWMFFTHCNQSDFFFQWFPRHKTKRQFQQLPEYWHKLVLQLHP